MINEMLKLGTLDFHEF